MPDPHGFMKHPRRLPSRRPVDVRIQDWHEVYPPTPESGAGWDRSDVREQAGRCMDCGIPFCHEGCPLGNLIPDWNDLVRTDDWRTAGERLHATNNFPEFTGRLCPAPCEAACVLAINDQPVTIEQIEKEIADRVWAAGWVEPHPSPVTTERRVAVVGSGPAGLAAAQQLTRAGHEVTVYERSPRLGGLLRYGIPEFKMEKHHIDRRLGQMRAEGTRFVTACEVGVDVPTAKLRDHYDAIVLAVGAEVGRDHHVPGRELDGVHLAMDYLVPANRVSEGTLAESPISAAGKRVVIIGGGDTAADCLGTAHRQGAASVVQLDIYPRPPDVRHESTPWPTWPLLLRSYAAHEEGGGRRFEQAVVGFAGEAGRLRSLRLRRVRVERDPDRGRVVVPVDQRVEEVPCDLALLAIGFDGVREQPLLTELGIAPDAAGRLDCTPDWQVAPGVFVAGDAKRGASLIVWAIAEGRSAAAAADRFLTGASALPAPVQTTSAALR